MEKKTAYLARRVRRAILAARDTGCELIRGDNFRAVGFAHPEGCKAIVTRGKLGREVLMLAINDRAMSHKDRRQLVTVARDFRLQAV